MLCQLCEQAEYVWVYNMDQGVTNLMSSDEGAKAFVREYTVQEYENMCVLEFLPSSSQKPRGRPRPTAQKNVGCFGGSKT